jgi:hypothetical protein
MAFRLGIIIWVWQNQVDGTFVDQVLVSRNILGNATSAGPHDIPSRSQEFQEFETGRSHG